MLQAIIWFSAVFVGKVLDSLLATTKTILVQKNRAVLAAASVIISQIIFYKLITVVASSSDDVTTYVIAVAGGVGTLLAIAINNELSREKTFVNIILCDEKDAMINLIEFLREQKITNLVTDAYTREWEKTYAVTAYAETKMQSKLLDEFLEHSAVKFKRIVQ